MTEPLGWVLVEHLNGTVGDVGVSSGREHAYRAADILAAEHPDVDYLVCALVPDRNAADGRAES